MSDADYRLRSVGRQSLAVLLATTALGVVSAHAVNGTWTGANSDEWTDGANWSSNPNVPDGTATFTNTGPNSVQSNGLVSVGGVQFTAAPNAQSYTIDANDIVVVNGSGIINNSTNTQTFNVNAGIVFLNASTASGGSQPVTYNNSFSMTFQDSSTAGTAIVTNNGSLSFNNTSTAGASTITSNASADFFGSSSAGTSHITNDVNGTLTFNNTATAATSTITNNGTVQFNGSSTAASATINGADGSTTTFNNTSTAGSANINLVLSAALTFNDTSSAGTAHISANALGGAIIFNNSSTAASSTIHLADTSLTFNNASTAGSATISMVDQLHPGTITFNNTSTAANANITVVGSLGAGGGTLTFLDTSTAGNATIANNTGTGSGGQTIFGTLGGTDTSNAGTAHITNNSLGTTSFLAATSASTATITNNTGGNANFQDQSTASGATILNNGGTTNFGVPLVGTDTATAGTANITNNSGGTTNFNAATTAGSATVTTNSGGKVFFFDTSTGGSARFITNTGGVFDMSGLSATGMTAGSIEGAGNYFLGAKNLTVGNGLSTTVSGVISNGGTSGGTGGALTKVGTGSLTLSNTNTYTGATTVNNGALIVDGSTALSSLTTVNTNGTLAGSGTVGATAIAGGTLAPGSATGSIFGPLAVQGNLSFTAASTYMIQVTPANAGRTNVTGTATLGGATVNANFAAGSYVSRQYTIVNATVGVSGTFNPTVISNMANLQSTLSYDAHDAFLNIQLAFTPPGGNLNVNQQNVANTLINFFNRTGGIPLAFAALNAGGLTQISGEAATGSQQTTFQAMGLFMGLLTDPFVAGRGDGMSAGGAAATGYASTQNSGVARDAYAMFTKAPVTTFDQRWSVWAAGYGGSQTTDGNATLGSNTATSSVYGGAVGADYRFSPNTIAGFALAGGGTSFSVANALGSGRSDLFQAGGFIRHTAGPAYISAALAYGWQDITTDRTVTVAGVDHLRAEFKANAWSGRVEGGYRFVTPWMGITPYAAGQFTTFELPNYAETAVSGANTFALAYNAKSVTDTRSELGIRTDKSFAMQDGILTLRSRFAWAHDFNPDRNIAATFQTLPGASFVVNGAAQAHDSALTTASAEMKWLNGFSLAATFEGEFSGVTTSYAGKGVARYAW